ncbi:MAG: DMT family transporter [Notoacmeibacter sp.]|nr:DMT family transporter [Notoacmeibacter sp.]
MAVTPLFFSSNLIFGRDVVGDVAPFLLAAIRWALVALALSPFLWRDRMSVRAAISAHWPFLLLLGFLGMFICGGLVYLGLTMTTATNGTLIYTTSPVIIILIEAVFSGRKIGWREAVGSLLAFAGVAVIVLKGDWEVLSSLTFNPGDILFVIAAIAWAIYSILGRKPVMTNLGNFSALGLTALAGTLCLLPVALFEVSAGHPLPSTVADWANIAGIVFFASLLAFAGFQFGVRRLGASLAGIFMYLLPAYGVSLAVLWLGEAFKTFHATGIALVMAGIMLATFPVGWARRKLGAA